MTVMMTMYNDNNCRHQSKQTLTVNRGRKMQCAVSMCAV
jgi:hypothetical protein